MYAKKICNLVLELGIIVLIVFPPIVFGAVYPRHITAIQVIILLIALVWLAKTFLKGGFTYVPGPFELPIAVFTGLGVVNFLTSTYPHATEHQLYLFLHYALLYFFVTQHLRTVRRILGLAFIIVLIGSGESLFGLFQYLQGAKTVLGYPVTNIGTVNATYISHNHFAGFLVMVLPIALGLLVGAGNLEKKFFVFLLLGMMGAALVLTLSRGGLLSFFVAVSGFFLCLLSKAIFFKRTVISWRAVLLLLVLLGLFVATYVGFIGISPIAHRSLVETFVPTAEVFRQEIRFPLWRNVLRLVPEFPLTGSGLGSFHDVFLRYRPAEMPLTKQAFHAHNDYLELLVETGVPGLLIALWAMFRFLRDGLRGYFRHHDPVLTALLLGGLTSCTAILVHSFFDFNLHIPANALLFVIVAGMATAIVHLMRRGRHKNRRAKKRHPEPDQGYRIKVSWRFTGAALAVVVILGLPFYQHLALHSYNRAERAVRQGNSCRAIEHYQRAIAHDRNNPMFHARLAALYTSLGNVAPHKEKWYQLAVDAYQQAIALRAYHPDYEYHLGWVYDRMRREEEAVNAFQAAIDKNPRIPFYYENLGRYFLTMQQYEAAVRRLRKAVQLDPQRLPEILQICQQQQLPQTYYQDLLPQEAGIRRDFAALLDRQGRWEASKAEYRKAIELSDHHTDFYEAMLAACQGRNDYECLRTLWRELGNRDPQHSENWAIKIAESFAQQQRWDEAITYYQRILTDSPENVRIYQRLAELYQHQERPEEAVALYHQIIAIQPETLQHYHDLADLYRRRQQWQKAIGVYEQALEAGLTTAEVYANLGQLQAQLGNPDQARQSYEQAIQAGETRIEVYHKLAHLYRAANRKIDEELLWETYILANHDKPEGLFQLVQHYHNAGHWLQAVQLSKELIANAPTTPRYRTFLAQLYEHQGLFFEAATHWKKLVNRHPHNVQYRFRLAELYERSNQPDNARLQYRRILRLQPNNQDAQQKLATLGGDL